MDCAATVTRTYTATSRIVDSTAALPGVRSLSAVSSFTDTVESQPQ